LYELQIKSIRRENSSCCCCSQTFACLLNFHKFLVYFEQERCHGNSIHAPLHSCLLLEQSVNPNYRSAAISLCYVELHARCTTISLVSVRTSHKAQSVTTMARQGRCNTQSTLHPPNYSTTCSEHGTAIPMNDFDLFSMAHLSHLKTCKNFKTISLFPEELWQQQTHKQTNTQTRSSYIRYKLIFVFKRLI
jgi:hypothetical protein